MWQIRYHYSRHCVTNVWSLWHQPSTVTSSAGREPSEWDTGTMCKDRDFYRHLRICYVYLSGSLESIHFKSSGWFGVVSTFAILPACVLAEDRHVIPFLAPALHKWNWTSVLAVNCMSDWHLCRLVTRSYFQLHCLVMHKASLAIISVFASRICYATYCNSATCVISRLVQNIV